ncbi:MAG: LTA synthase family protein [Rhodocyclaceae bacterium]|nr:LTA synthase family protein [Rhodocyclaceae bacterium]
MTGLDDAPLAAAPAVLGYGLLDDLRAAVFIAAPFWLALIILPTHWLGHRPRLWLRAAVLFVTFALLIFGVVSEWVFWGEFSTRFNFIAVDYLLYTHEVVANIVQSYPVGWMFAGIGLVALLLTRLSLPPPLFVSPAHPFRRRFWRGVAGGIALPALVLTLPAPPVAATNPYTEELSRNGLVSLVQAAWQNELDYRRFYATLPQQQADTLLASLGVRRAPLSQPQDDAAMMDAPAPIAVFMRMPRHVVLVTVESLSADYMAAFGNTRGLTHNLDRLADESLFFTRFYATGTRTVRGLEAVSLGTPPVPGQAIVRRPKNEHLAMVGQLAALQGFDPVFLYGGNGFFDNMNAYFGGNGYRIVDRGDIPASKVTFENAWGMADEVLFDQALEQVDRAEAGGKRLFAHVMTTSNHRPYTYPDKRIDIPSPGGRPGAVKYTDWAIGDFLAKARAKPWFKDTLFVILADHCASAAGKTRLPVDRYHIPMFFYAPDLLAPARYERLMSQIDLPPTLVQAMGLKGGAHFFGRSILDGEAPERVFISNYQELGYLKDGLLTVLRPKRQVEAYRIDPHTDAATPAAVDPKLRDEAIAYYQTASAAFREGRLRLP